MGWDTGRAWGNEAAVSVRALYDTTRAAEKLNELRPFLNRFDACTIYKDYPLCVFEGMNGHLILLHYLLRIYVAESSSWRFRLNTAATASRLCILDWAYAELMNTTLKFSCEYEIIPNDLLDRSLI